MPWARSRDCSYSSLICTSVTGCNRLGVSADEELINGHAALLRLVLQEHLANQVVEHAAVHVVHLLTHARKRRGILLLPVLFDIAHRIVRSPTVATTTSDALLVVCAGLCAHTGSANPIENSITTSIGPCSFNQASSRPKLNMRSGDREEQSRTRTRNVKNFPASPELLIPHC